MDGELAARRVQRGQQQRGRAGRADQAHRPAKALGVHSSTPGDVEHRRLGERADDLVRRGDHRVGALGERGRRHAGVEAEMRAPRLVHHQRRVVSVGDLGEGGDVGRQPVVGRRDDEGRPRVGSAGQRRFERVPGDAVRHPQLRLERGSDPGRDPAREHEAVDHAAVRVALHDDRRAQGSQREAQRVVALRGPVVQEPRPPGAVEVGGQALGEVEGRGDRRGDVDAPHVLGNVDEQGVLADVVAQRRVGARPALVPGHVEARRLPEPVGRDRLEIRGDALLELLVAHRSAPAWARR